MKKLLFILTFFPFFVFAENKFNEQVNACKLMTDSNQRLSCYDSLFDKKVEIKNNEDQSGNWKVTEETSPIDDSKTVILVLNADNDIRVKYDKKTPHLVIRCKEKKTELYIGFNVFLGTDKIYPITRADSEKAISDVAWNISTDNQAIFYSGYNYKKSIKITDFLKTLQNKSKYFIQLTPYSESPVNTTFTLTGLKEALKPLRSACGW